MAKIDSIPSMHHEHKNLLRKTWEMLSEKPRKSLVVAFAALLLSWGTWFKVNQMRTHTNIQEALVSATQEKKAREPAKFWLEWAVLKECTDNPSFIDEMNTICQKNSALFLASLIREISANPQNEELQKLDILFEKVSYKDLSEEWKELIIKLSQDTFFRKAWAWKMQNLQKIMQQAPSGDISWWISDFIKPKTAFGETVKSVTKWLNWVIWASAEFETKNAKRIHDEYVWYAARAVLKELDTYKKILSHLALNTNEVDWAIKSIQTKKTEANNPLWDLPFQECVKLIGMQNNWPHICENIQEQVSWRILQYAQAVIELKEAEQEAKQWNDKSKEQDAKAEGKKQETRLYRAIEKVLASNNQWLIGEIFSKIPKRYENITEADKLNAEKYRITRKNDQWYKSLEKEMKKEIDVGEGEKVKLFMLMNEANLASKNIAKALIRSQYKENVDFVIRLSGNDKDIFRSMLIKYYEDMKPKNRK